MYHVLSESENGYVGIKIQRKLTHDDYDLLLLYIKSLTQEVGTVRLLYDMTECGDMDSQGLWEELTSKFQQFNDVPRVAVVGDSHWMACGTKVFHPLLKTTVQYFLPDQLDKAWAWLKEGETSKKC